MGVGWWNRSELLGSMGVQWWYGWLVVWKWGKWYGGDWIV